MAFPVAMPAATERGHMRASTASIRMEAVTAPDPTTCEKTQVNTEDDGVPVSFVALKSRCEALQCRYVSIFSIIDDEELTLRYNFSNWPNELVDGGKAILTSSRLGLAKKARSAGLPFQWRFGSRRSEDPDLPDTPTGYPAALQGFFDGWMLPVSSSSGCIGLAFVSGLEHELSADEVFDLHRQAAHAVGYFQSSSVVDQDSQAGLNDSHLGVLQDLSDGKSKKEIGERLGLSETGVEMIVKSAQNRLGAMSTVHAVAIAIRSRRIT